MEDNYVMPTKQYLMGNYASAAEILEYAVANHNTDSQLVHVKKVGGAVQVRCKDATNPVEVYDGTGVSKHEAMADCISTKFPG